MSVNNVLVAGCTGRFRCFNPLIVANAFDNNSVIVIFTNPPTSFLYENYDVCLKYRFRVKYIQTVKLEVSAITTVDAFVNLRLTAACGVENAHMQSLN